MYYEARLGKRFLAYLIDVFVLVILLYISSLITSTLVYPESDIPKALIDFTNSSNFSFKGLIELVQNDKEVANFFFELRTYILVAFFVGFIIYIIYFVVIPSYFKNFQTLGRFVTKTLVVKDPEGYLVSFKNNFLRWLADILILIMNPFLGIGLFFNLFLLTSRNRTLGDILGKTKLIDLNQQIIVKNVDNINTIEENSINNDDENTLE